MSLFDSFSLPKLSGGGSVSDSAISYATASTGQLLNEGYAKVQSTFNSVGNFASLAKGLPSFASLGSVNGALGALSSKNPIPGLAASAANITSPSGTAAQLNSNVEANVGSVTSHKVMLTASSTDGASSAILNDVNFPVEPLSEARVEFDIMPEVSENRVAEYEALSAPQMPGEFQKYRGTKSVAWQITGMFTARTRDEAKRNYIYLNTLRGWTMPYFGDKQKTQFSGSGKLGAPPPVINFTGWRGLVGSVPVVITGVNWSFPKDCDWIPTGIIDPESRQEIPFPTVMNVNVQMVESFSALQFNGFDLVAFRNGRMIDAFAPVPRGEGSVARSEATGGQQGITNSTPTPDLESETISEATESVATPAAAQPEAPAPVTPTPFDYENLDPATGLPLKSMSASNLKYTLNNSISNDKSNIKSLEGLNELYTSKMADADPTERAKLENNITQNNAGIAAANARIDRNQTKLGSTVGPDPFERRQIELAKIAQKYDLDITVTPIIQ
jgi:hypothetical protein